MTASPESRRAMIEERQKNSAIWFIIHFLGSLRIAMFLLFTIALACAIATFAESAFNTKVAQHYIYKAPWFMVWLLILCLNLFCAAFTRWPWQRKHVGFVVTHAGIITLLTGAMIGSVAGYEANVSLSKTQPPTNRLTINQFMLQVESPRDGAAYLMPLPVEVPRPTEARPRVESLPDTQLRLVVDRYAENLETATELESGGPEAPAGVMLRLSSQTLGRTVIIPLHLGSEEARHRDFFGLAQIELSGQLPAVAATAEKSPGTFRETQMIFAARPDQPVVHNNLNRSSGYQFALDGDPASNTLELAARTPAGKEARWPLTGLRNQRVSIPGDSATIEVNGYWPDFVMENGKPASRSTSPSNPAMLITVSGPLSAAPAPSRPAFLLSPGSGNNASYQLRRGDALIASGTLAAGSAISLGWNDWQAELLASYPHAKEKEVVREISGPGADGVPGIHARLRAPDGTTSEAVWILPGSFQKLSLGPETIPMAFGLRIQRIPFLVGLDNFEVPRDEGTDTPANFISTLRFQDPQTGAVRIDVARMNHPATYPGGLWRSMLGLNYKFSQASWDPNDLNQTVLQVLFDPGWPLKWIGSLGICAGIAIMFYFKESSSAKKNRPPRKTPDYELAPTA